MTITRRFWPNGHGVPWCHLKTSATKWAQTPPDSNVVTKCHSIYVYKRTPSPIRLGTACPALRSLCWWRNWRRSICVDFPHHLIDVLESSDASPQPRGIHLPPWPTNTLYILYITYHTPLLSESWLGLTTGIHSIFSKSNWYIAPTGYTSDSWEVINSSLSIYYYIRIRVWDNSAVWAESVPYDFEASLPKKAMLLKKSYYIHRVTYVKNRWERHTRSGAC